jgi:hypothetical protein
MSVITPSTFDAKKLTVSDIKKLDNGSSQVYINYDGKRLRVQAPRLPVPMSASDYQGNQKYKVMFSFKDRTSNPKVTAYYSMLEQIDNFVVEQATKNAGKWFKLAGASKEMISLFYTPSIKTAKDKDGNVKDYPPTQSVALKQRNGSWEAELYDDRKQLMEGVSPMDVLRRGAEVTPIIDASSIWVADKKFGLQWKLVQARVDRAGEGGVNGCLIQEDGEEAPVVVSSTEEKSLMDAVLPNEDEEEEEEDDEVIPAPPVPKKASTAPKKVVKKTGAKA